MTFNANINSDIMMIEVGWKHLAGYYFIFWPLLKVISHNVAIDFYKNHLPCQPLNILITCLEYSGIFSQISIQLPANNFTLKNYSCKLHCTRLAPVIMKKMLIK